MLQCNLQEKISRQEMIECRQADLPKTPKNKNLQVGLSRDGYHRTEQTDIVGVCLRKGL